MLCVVGAVEGVTQLHDVVYIVHGLFSVLLMFNATTYQHVGFIHFKDSQWPRDIVACEQTSQLYLADWMQHCIWRMSPGCVDKQRWLDIGGRCSLSVTSTRLLVTSHCDSKLLQLDAHGNRLRFFGVRGARHAVESPTGTFIVSRSNVTEVNTGGQVLREFSGSHVLFPSLFRTPHIAVDSHGNIFVADRDNHRILLLDSHLKLRRIIVDADQLYYQQPLRLCYMEQSGQLLVGLYNGEVVVFDVLCIR